MVTQRNSIKFSIGELKALTLLARNSGGLFGSQLVNLSDGFLVRGTVYTLLNRLLEKGLVEYSIVAASAEFALDRPLYRISKQGLTSINEFAGEFGFIWKE